MATWRAECWIGSTVGRQTLEVESETSNGAIDQFQRVYGAKTVTNIRRIDNRTSDRMGDGVDIDSAITCGAIIGAIYAIIHWWYVCIPILILVAVAVYFYYKK